MRRAIARTAVLFVVLTGCGGGGGGSPSDASTGCTGGDPVSGLVFEGAAGMTTSIGGAHIDTCAVQHSGCPNGAAGTCVSLSFGGSDGTRSMVVAATVPLASGTFDCASSDLVRVSLNQIDARGDTVFGGVAGRTGSQLFGSCTIASTALDASHWAGQIDAQLEDRLHGTTASLSLTGHMAAR
jgi:hypothetical protein